MGRIAMSPSLVTSLDEEQFIVGGKRTRIECGDRDVIPEYSPGSVIPRQENAGNGARRLSAYSEFEFQQLPGCGGTNRRGSDRNINSRLPHRNLSGCRCTW